MNLNSQRKACLSLAGFLAYSAVFLVAGVLFASFISLFIVRLAENSAGILGSILTEKGPEAIARRVLLITYIAVLALLIRKTGWRGLRDSGFSSNDPETPSAGRSAITGIVAGILSMLPLLVAGMMFTPRFYNPPVYDASFAIAIISFAVSGIIIALIEETICRGVLFRTLARANGFWKAAFVTSLFFAIAHFLYPATESFTGESFFKTGLNVFMSSFTSIPEHSRFAIRILNLTLLGAVLCALVKRTGTIWMAIGAHAAWVWLIKIFHYLTHIEDSAKTNVWFGGRSDAMDSFSATIILILLMAWALNRSTKNGVKKRIGRFTWHIHPDEQDKCEKWIAENVKDSPYTPADSDTTFKKYPGCIVAGTEYCIYKEYRPASKSAALRFAVKQSRAEKAFTIARQLIDKGISVPKHLAWGFGGKNGMKNIEFLLTNRIHNSTPLNIILSNDNPAGKEDEESILKLYAGLMASFHVNNFSNRDLKDENVLVTGAPGERRLWAVDMDGVRRVKFMSGRRVRRDLYRVGQSLKSKGRLTDENERIFFQTYNSLAPARLKQSRFSER